MDLLQFVEQVQLLKTNFNESHNKRIIILKFYKSAQKKIKLNGCSHTSISSNGNQIILDSIRIHLSFFESGIIQKWF